MPILYYRPEEMLLLSSLCEKTPSPASPMRRHYVRAAQLTSAESSRATIEDLVRRKQVYGDAQGRLHLDPNLQPVFWMLNSPDQVFALSRIGQPDMAECYFCSSGTLWVQNAVNVFENVELVLYPFNWEQIRQWFCDDFLKDVKPAGRPMAARRFRLHMAELFLLLAIQEEYGQRVLKARRALKLEELWVDIGRLGRPEMRATLEPLGRTFMGDRFQSFLGDPALLKKVALGLSQRGLVAVKDGRARLAKTGRRILDPGRMLACVIAKSFVPRLTAKVLYLREDGYLLVSPSQSDELTTWLSWIPGSVPKRRIFERLMKGLAAAPETPGYVRSRKPIVRQAPSPAETLRPVPTDRTLPLGTDAPTIIVAPAAGRLRLVEGGTLGRPGTTVYPLKEGAVLGREAGCQIHLEDAVLSRRHCQFTRHPDGAWWIEDLKSSNGTFVNDDRLTAPRALRPGDRIKVGGEILLFETELHS